MGASDAIRDLLPSLWRPEPDARGLLADLLSATGSGLDLARVDGGNTMQAHWSRFADYAPISPYVAAYRKAAKEPVLLPGDPEVETHPYLDDLARLAGLLALVPYTDPTSTRETVEQFRRRVLGTVGLWRDGVATRAAIGTAARLALSGTAERAVNVEEFAPGVVLSHIGKPRGQPEDLVGPLMRWQVDAQSLAPVPAEVYITGATEKPGKIDSADQPLIERFDPVTGTGVGVLYDGTIEAGQTLALRPSFSSWLGGDGAVQVATSTPGDSPANPTASGPWALSAGAPAGRVTGLANGADGALWATADAAGTGALWRWDGTAWSEAIGGLPALHCLVADGNTMLVGHANGLSRLDVFAAPLAMQPDAAGLSDAAVFAVDMSSDGTIWAATSSGAAAYDAALTRTTLGPGARAETETALAAVMVEADGVITFGGTLGLFRHDSRAGHWHVFKGESLDEGTPDWAAWDPDADALPTDADVFLPAVTALQRGPNTLLWIGTEQGLAMWGAFRIRNTYATRLRAFPALGMVRINAIEVDERQRLWIGTERGLWLHDGLDWFEAADMPVRLPREETEAAGSGWRYDRTGATWQFAQGSGLIGFTASAPSVITSAHDPVNAIAWTDGAVAQLGTLSGDRFTPDDGATLAALRFRVKPSPDRIVEGAIPAIPRLQPGKSDWRYLRAEENTPPEPKTFPAWTREGRLLTPPDERAAPFEGRYRSREERASLDQVFAFNPAATVTFKWQPRAPFSITVRLDQPDPEETLSGVVVDRVFEAADRVRPAAARLRVALGETVLKGDSDG